MDPVARRRRCLHDHLGLWLCEPNYLTRAVRAVNAGLTGDFARYDPGEFASARWIGDLAIERALLAGDDAAVRAEIPQERPAAKWKPYLVDHSGIAVLEFSGPMLKGDSKFADKSTVTLRRELREAARDADATGILLVMDSPGGSVAGTDELARDVARAAEAKPLRVHGDDMLASAAYWAASAAETITLGPTAEVGSIGVVGIIEDLSVATEQAGVKVHVVSTGPFKGAAVPGTVITPEHLDYFRERVDSLAEHFFAAVRRGRKMSAKALEAVTDGRVWSGKEAIALGLADRVRSLDDALEDFRAAVGKRRPTRRASVAVTASLLSIEKSRLIRRASIG